jgi:hypothetical protein
LGIISICFCWALVGAIAGIIALVMASTDLQAMDSGTMDASGRGQTQAGRTCAIIGLVMTGLASFSCCGIAIVSNMH